MTRFLTKTSLAIALGATALTAAVPAQAQRYETRRSHSDTGTIVVAGLAGLAVGALIASGSHDRDRYRDGYYDQGYYDRGVTYDRRGYRDDRRHDRRYDRRQYRTEYRGSYQGGYYDDRGYRGGGYTPYRR